MSGNYVTKLHIIRTSYVASRTCRAFTLVATVFSLHEAVFAEHLALWLEEARIVGQLDRS